MKPFTLLFLIGLFSCTPKKLDTTHIDPPAKDSTVNIDESIRVVAAERNTSLEEKEEKEDEEEEEADVDEDCVFDNDYETVTAKWLDDIGIRDFTWDEVNTRAVVIVEADTMYATFGGCVHFGMTAEQIFRLTDIPLSDSAYWLGHGLRLARLFDFKFYASEIEKGNLTFEPNGPTDVWFFFGDDNSEDNLFYNGIQVKEAEGAITVSLSQYYN